MDKTDEDERGRVLGSPHSRIITNLYQLCQNNKIHNMENSPYQEQPYRYVIISIYLLASLVNQIPANTFSAMTSNVQNQFGIPGILVTLNFLFFPISHCIFAMPVNWALTKKGIRFSFIVGAVFMVIGVWLRITLTPQDPYVCLLGSLLSGGSSLILLSSASKVTVNWFKKQNITQVTFLCVLVNFLSLSIGLILPGIFINQDSTKQDILSFLKVQAIIVTIPFVLLAIFIKQKPEVPPSRHAEKEHQNTKNRYRDVLKLLFKNKNYWKLVIVMCLTFGTVVGYLSIIEKGLKGLGYKNPPQILTISVASLTFFGILGNIFFSAFVKKTKKYRLISIILIFGFLFGYAFLNAGFFFQLESVWQLIIISALMGFTYYAIPSYFVVYGAQIAFPVDQASVAGYLFAISQTFGFIVGLILVPLLDVTSENSIILFSVLGVIILLGAILTPFVEQDLRKQKFEQGLIGQVGKSQLKEQISKVLISKDQLSITSEQQERREREIMDSKPFSKNQ